VNYFRHLAARPAYRRISATNSSAQTFVTHDTYPAAINDTIDYYAKGMVIAFGLDAMIRSTIEGESLDTALSRFYSQFACQGAGYTTTQVLDFFAGISPELSDQLRRCILGTEEIELSRYLGKLGFTVVTDEFPYLGLVLKNDAGPEIYGVCDDGPAGRSGLAPEDVIVSVNGYPFSLKALKWVRENEQVLSLCVLRGNQPRNYEIPVGKQTGIGSLTWDGDEQQASRIAAWMERDFDPRQGEPFALDFYENFHGIETVL